MLAAAVSQLDSPLLVDLRPMAIELGAQQGFQAHYDAISDDYRVDNGREQRRLHLMRARDDETSSNLFYSSVDSHLPRIWLADTCVISITISIPT